MSLDGAYVCPPCAWSTNDIAAMWDHIGTDHERCRDCGERLILPGSPTYLDQIQRHSHHRAYCSGSPNPCPLHFRPCRCIVGPQVEGQPLSGIFRREVTPTEADDTITTPEADELARLRRIEAAAREIPLQAGKLCDLHTRECDDAVFDVRCCSCWVGKMRQALEPAQDGDHGR